METGVIWWAGACDRYLRQRPNVREIVIHSLGGQHSNGHVEAVLSSPEGGTRL